MRVIESFQEFALRQGCPCVEETGDVSFRTGYSQRRILFANGAVWVGEGHCAEPPTDPRQLLLAKRGYVVAQLDRETREFTAYKESVLTQAGFHELNPSVSPPPPATAPDVLREGQRRILELRAQLAELDDLLEDKDAARRRQEQARAEAESSSRAAWFKQTVYSIQI